MSQTLLVDAPVVARPQTFVVVVDVPSVAVVPRLLAVLQGAGDLIVVSYGHGGDQMGDAGDLRLIRTTGTQEQAVAAGLAAAAGDWVTVLLGNELPMLEPHLHALDALPVWCADKLKLTGLPRAPMLANLPTALANLPASVNAVAHLVPWVEDTAARVCRAVALECRTVRRSEAQAAQWGPEGFKGVLPAAAVPELVIIHQSTAAAHLEHGDSVQAQVLTEGDDSPLARCIFLKARAENDRRKALDAFKVLFTHYSLHEELWRLGEVMKHLPYDLEECAEMEEYRTLLRRQIGHLNLDGAGPRDWYADGSPSEVANVAYALGAEPSQRYQWLIAECRRRGFKRAVEFGSVDGIGLFPLQKGAPEIEWHGVEVNPKAVEHGHKVAKEAGLAIHLHHAPSFAAFACRVGGHQDARGRATDDRFLTKFDASFVFEVLEHNTPEEGQAILRSAESVVRPGGRVFISTPNGNWSAHDQKTRVLDLKKDHIYAFTEKRMRAFLSGKKDVEVFAVENANFREANSNVHASYEVP